MWSPSRLRHPGLRKPRLRRRRSLRSTLRRLRLEPLEERTLLAAVPFSDPLVIQETFADWPRAVVAADLDGDGDADLISGSYFDAKVAWYENRLNETPSEFGRQQVITTNAQGAVSLVAADVDGDGDQDVIAASQRSDKVAWYENRLDESTADFGPERLITMFAFGVNSVFSADLDGDGDQDLISTANNDKVVWYENRLNVHPASSWTARIIKGNLSDVRSVFAADLDGDGDKDVLSASSTANNKIAWYENRLGEASNDFGPQQVITDRAFDARSVFAGDLDGDGDADVLAASRSGREITWYENRLDEPTASFGPEQIVAASEDSDIVGVSVLAADLDGDGDLDVLAATLLSQSTIAWHENRLDEPPADFGPQQAIVTSASGLTFLFTSDLDGDGDSDVITGSPRDGNIAWYENRLNEPAAEFGTAQLVTTSALQPRSAIAADLDGDGDPDVLSASYFDDKIAWYENRLDETTADFRRQQVITSHATGAWSVLAADLDGDGDLDVLSASKGRFGIGQYEIAWYENRLDEPTADFGPQQVVTSTPYGGQSVVAADLDGDGDFDLVTGASRDRGAAWYENRLDELTADFGPPQLINPGWNEPGSVFTVDLDGDGDSDVLEGTRRGFFWAENRLDEASADFAFAQWIATSADWIRSVFAADLDNDGDQDVLSASYFDDTIAWYENRLDEPTADIGPMQPITTSANGANSVITADIDGDGDQDVLSASLNDDKIAWYENRLDEATADFGPQRVITTQADGAMSVFAADLDSDGDRDVVSASDSTLIASPGRDDTIAWYRNERIGPVGDMNLDAIADLDDVEDFVLALIDPSAYEARHGLPAASRGDTDGDGDLDVDDVDGFVALVTEAGSGGGQSPADTAAGHATAHGAEHTASVRAVPSDPHHAAALRRTANSISESTHDDRPPLNNGAAAQRSWIAHTALTNLTPQETKARDAVFASVVEVSPPPASEAFHSLPAGQSGNSAAMLPASRQLASWAVSSSSDDLHDTVFADLPETCDQEPAANPSTSSGQARCG